MKQAPQVTLVGIPTTLVDVWKWGQELERLYSRFAPRFVLPEPRHRALAYLKGIVSGVSRKNGWQLAEQAGEGRPDGMQRLLNSAVWDEDLVRDDLRAYILERLGDPEAVLVIDETSFPKRGKKSAGVKKQYCGTTGKVENCQVGVFLSYVSEKGHTHIDLELYLPKKDWIDDLERRREAGIPEEIRFQTKCELAQKMVERMFQAGIPFAWVVADTVYGGNQDLRTWLEAHHYSYVLAVACDEPVGIQTASGRKQMTVAEAALSFQESCWQRLSMNNGLKGPRLYDWAVMPRLHAWEDDGRHFLLVRRCLDNPQEMTYYFVFAPLGTTLAEMVKAIGKRWHIEQDFETGKEMGLGDYEVRCFTAWYRHITLVMIVQACLAGICAAVRIPTAKTAPHEGMPLTCPVLPLTIPEVRHLLAHLLFPPPRSQILWLSWSWWRRCHQTRASFFHTKRRCLAA